MLTNISSKVSNCIDKIIIDTVSMFNEKNINNKINEIEKNIDILKYKNVKYIHTIEWVDYKKTVKNNFGKVNDINDRYKDIVFGDGIQTSINIDNYIQLKIPIYYQKQNMGILINYINQNNLLDDVVSPYGKIVALYKITESARVASTLSIVLNIVFKGHVNEEDCFSIAEVKNYNLKLASFINNKKLSELYILEYKNSILWLYLFGVISFILVYYLMFFLEKRRSGHKNLILEENNGLKLKISTIYTQKNIQEKGYDLKIKLISELYFKNLFTTNKMFSDIVSLNHPDDYIGCDYSEYIMTGKVIKDVFEKIDVNISECIKEISAILFAEKLYHLIELDSKIIDENVQIDQTYFKLILLNLFRIAVNDIPETGVVSIKKIEGSSTYIGLVISTNGFGYDNGTFKNDGLNISDISIFSEKKLKMICDVMNINYNLEKIPYQGVRIVITVPINFDVGINDNFYSNSNNVYPFIKS